MHVGYSLMLTLTFRPQICTLSFSCPAVFSTKLDVYSTALSFPISRKSEVRDDKQTGCNA